MLQGPDTSSYQGAVDWRAVAASGRAFAWSKATEGSGYTNPYFAANWPGMRAAGLARGAYHFARPDLGSPEDQADFFLFTVGNLQPGDLLALDVEVGQGDLLGWVLTFLDQVAAAAGFKPLLYSGNWFLNDHNLYGDPDLGQYGLWLAAYQNGVPQLPPAWVTLAMWQDTNNASIPGIDGPCDESYFFGSLTQLLAYGKPGYPAAPALTTPQQLVTIDSVIGDNTYPDGSDMYALADNQPVSRVTFIRQLIQHAKLLPGIAPDSVTRLSVMGDATYPDGVDMDSRMPNRQVSRRVFIRELVQEDKATYGAS